MWYVMIEKQVRLGRGEREVWRLCAWRLCFVGGVVY